LRIARNLHDTVAQNVSYLRFKLDQLSTSAVKSEPAEFQQELTKTVAVADEIYEQMRDTLEELRITKDQDLEQTIQQYAAQAAERTGFSLSIRNIGQPKALPPRKSRQIMYIVREALNNVEKHASAENVDILMHYSDEEFVLSVRDDGVGIQPGATEIDDRYGMAIMGERARAIHGNLTIASKPEEGTEVVLHLPLMSGTDISSKNQ
jgi:two-component system nitrate/nitrite sensor histidine kinase NarX